MKTTLRFNTLEELASYTKKVSPNGYRMNTLELSLYASLSFIELIIAIEQYGAKVVQPYAAA
jgi:hypothetical protein